MRKARSGISERRKLGNDWVLVISEWDIECDNIYGVWSEKRTCKWMGRKWIEYGR